MNTNFKVIGLIRLGIKPKSTAPEADALTIRPSELFEIMGKMYTSKTLLKMAGGRMLTFHPTPLDPPLVIS